MISFHFIDEDNVNLLQQGNKIIKKLFLCILHCLLLFFLSTFRRNEKWKKARVSIGKDSLLALPSVSGLVEQRLCLIKSII